MALNDIHIRDALARLNTGRPRDKKNREDLDQGRLRINKSSLAREIPCSRTTLDKYLEGSEELAKILAGKPAKAARATATDNVNRLRAENKELRDQIRNLTTQNAWLVLRVQDLERSVKNERRKAEAAASRSFDNPNVVSIFDRKGNPKHPD